MKKYQKIETELDKIIISEINSRFTGKPKKSNPGKVRTLIEKKNREIVRTHQRGKTASNLTMLFSGYLQIREGGKLFFGRDDLEKKEFESYLGKKNRLEALLGASLNTLKEETLINLVYRKRKRFDDEYHKAKEVMQLIQEAGNLRKEAEEPEMMIPKDEETAISYLEDIAPLTASLQKIESRYIELKEDVYIAEVLQQLQSAINLAFKSITLQSRKASRFLFDQVRLVFQKHKSARAGLSSIDEFIAQKEELVRYYTIFDSIEDDTRKKQTGNFILAVENAIEKLHERAARQKEREAEISEKNQQDVEDAYNRFLEIKEQYAEGDLDTSGAKRRAVSALKRSQYILRSNGQQIKARDIDRFLNATGINRKEGMSDAPQNAPQNQNMFYKRAFLGILPITIALALLNVYHIFSRDDDVRGKDKIAVIKKHKKTVEEPPVRSAPSEKKQGSENGQSPQIPVKQAP